MFAALILTLPTQPNAVRLRVWRALKSAGLRLAARRRLPVARSDSAALFEPLAPRCASTAAAPRCWTWRRATTPSAPRSLALFDRSEAYAQWRGDRCSALRRAAGWAKPKRGAACAAWPRPCRRCTRIDYYPGPAAEQAEADLSWPAPGPRRRFSRGEPHRARRPTAIPRLDVRKHQGKRWATRARPWVDRLACAWLIRRFIDPRGALRLAGRPAERAPRGALGFDYDGARFTHVGARVSFEVMAASFGLESDPRLQRIARDRALPRRRRHPGARGGGPGRRARRTARSARRRRRADSAPRARCSTPSTHAPQGRAA